MIFPFSNTLDVATLPWKSVRMSSHSRNGDLGVLQDSQIFRVRLQGQNTSPWSVLYIIGKLSKYRYRKWACMSHLNICSTSYGKKKGRESNWQFDSRPLKVRNWPDPDACIWSATHRWKDLEESCHFLQTLSQSKVWEKSYSLTKLWESKPWQFQGSSSRVSGQKVIRMWVSLRAT